MALEGRRETLGIIAIGAAAFGYWYWKQHSSSAATSNAAEPDAGDTSAAGGSNIYVPGFDMAADNVVGPSQIYYPGGPVSGLTGPSAPVSAAGTAASNPAVSSSVSNGVRMSPTSGQAMPLPAHS